MSKKNNIRHTVRKVEQNFTSQIGPWEVTNTNLEDEGQENYNEE